LTEDKLVENADKTGRYFKESLLMLQEKHRIIREVRGLGMMLAVELRFEVRDVLLDALPKRFVDVILWKEYYQATSATCNG